ncbi:MULTISPECIES: hypothetical protein [unclassified Nocardia]|uniref:hypothetical protein n=1 Tax=unclassified Nocardia TaxID=2637762 RepID=UPI0024A805B3|nr:MULTISPECIES: hypothetical protein [unclassified Nocardia]
MSTPVSGVVVGFMSGWAHRWPGALLMATGVASAVFTLGTAVQCFVIVDLETLDRMMELADPAAADAMPWFLIVFRLAGSLYIVGNAVGMLGLLRRPWPWLFWIVVLVNATQAAGLVLVPPEMFTAAREEFGISGILPTVVTDGGAAVLTVVLVVTFLGTRAPWGHRRHSSAA